MEVSKWPSLSDVLGLLKHKGSVCVCVFPLETQSTGLGSEDESPSGSI